MMLLPAARIPLLKYTDQGIRNVKETPKRAEAAKEAAKKFGATIKDIYWTLGQYDVVATIDAPDDASVTAFALSIGMAGNVHTQTLRAFSADEMGRIIARL
jgi:uncharacterized protein with GYD domain